MILSHSLTAVVRSCHSRSAAVCRAGMVLGVAMLVALTAGCAPEPGPADDAITGETVRYQNGDVEMIGYLAYDAEQSGVGSEGRPGVLVVHEWWGLNDFAREQADRLAELGYVALAVDMYGAGRTTDDPGEARAWSSTFYDQPLLLRKRAAAGLEALRQQPQVDADRIAVIGFCFGGTTALELAYSGARVVGAVSFHGNPPALSEADAERLTASVLILHGADDPHVSEESLLAATNSLEQAGKDWKIVEYPGAVHSFTNPEADEHGMEGIAYHQDAAEQSWEEMKRFLEERFERAEQ